MHFACEEGDTSKWIQKTGAIKCFEQILTSVPIRCKRVCKVGAGQESTKNQCDTPGFALHTKPEIKVDHRRSQKLFQPRNHPRINQTSVDMLRSWRGNCDVQIIVYDSHPDCVDIREISKVTDYVVAYSCKGNCTLREEKEQNKKMILASDSITGDKEDVKRICKQVMNRVASKRVISKQETMVLLGKLALTGCSESIEKVSISASKKIKLASKGNSDSIDTKFINDYRDRSPWFHKYSLHDYYHHVKNHSRIKTKYKIPHFVGVQGFPCFPVSEAYAKYVLVVYKPWHGQYPKYPNWKIEFEWFINSRLCPVSARMTYDRVMQRHYDGTKFIDPKSHQPDYSLNPISEEDESDLLLVGLPANGEATDYDTALLQCIPRGETFKWDKTPMVSNQPERCYNRFEIYSYTLFSQETYVTQIYHPGNGLISRWNNFSSLMT